MAGTELRLAGANDPAFATLQILYADVLGGALCPALPSDQGMELASEFSRRAAR